MICLSAASFDGLTGKVHHTALAEFDDLTERHGEDLPALIATAVRETWRSVYIDMLFCNAIDIDTLVIAFRSGAIRAAVIAHGFEMGWAEAHNSSDLVEQALQSGAVNSERDLDTFKCVAVFWFAEASKSLENGDHPAAMNWIHEAYNALRVLHGHSMWDGSFQSACEAFQADPEAFLPREMATNKSRKNSTKGDRGDLLTPVIEKAMNLAEGDTRQALTLITKWAREKTEPAFALFHGGFFRLIDGKQVQTASVRKRLSRIKAAR